MASSLQSIDRVATAEQPQQNERSRPRSGIFKSFMHRRNNSEGSALPSAPLCAPPSIMIPPADETRQSRFSRGPAVLDEIQSNRIGSAHSRSPAKKFDDAERRHRPPSPIKATFSTLSLKSRSVKDVAKPAKYAKQEPASSAKPTKRKSTTNLAAIFRPKSLKNLHQQVSQEDTRSNKNKENELPAISLTTPLEESRSPIYAQYSSGALDRLTQPSLTTHKNASTSNILAGENKKSRPKSYHVAYTNKQEGSKESETTSMRLSPTKPSRGLHIFTNGLGQESKSTSSKSTSSKTPTQAQDERALDPKDVDKHLEAMLDRRNIPENQRYKMRNLSDTIKMEFIKQDWAETHGTINRSGSIDSDLSTNDGQRTRTRTFTLGNRSSKKSEPSSPTKKKGEGTLGRHFRAKSTESVASERPPSSGSASAMASGFLAKIKHQQGPMEFVSYLRKEQKPQLVEVGKMHKLRLLLRNETVAWTEEFIRQGGMQEIVGLLHRIMEVEWREDHEDALLHENLLCLKALCTTALAMQYLHSIQATLFPALLRMVFDPERKGPYDFPTRNIITLVLFTYISSASIEDRPVRARTVLAHLRDPKPKEEERPVEFVLNMRRERPYRVWNKEVVSVTKEAFWIFINHLNTVYLPRDKEWANNAAHPPADGVAYMQAHFPQERPPVPAAPYVGGVEWEATNYLVSHLDLLNAIVACTPTAGERNALREQMRVSGWERCLGGSLRCCKEKFYPGLHDGLRTWVAAAAEDGWDVRDVRYGPPPQPRSPVKNIAGGDKGKKKQQQQQEDQPPPRIEMPKLDFALDVSSAARNNGDWLS